MTVKFYDSVADFADRFDAFIIDLWGVLHDGTEPYPGAIETLQNLRNKNKKIILLSNAPRQAHKAESVLQSMGFDKNLYDHILTSGQVTHDYLAATNEHGYNYYYIGPEKDLDIIADLENYKIVDDVSEADFAIGMGFDNPGDGFETKQAQIDACLEKELLLICPNPDRIVVKQDGRIWICAGAIADYYHARGGEVISFGKPYPYVYEKCMEMVGLNDKEKYCAVGDSLHTDIAGANYVGIFSVLSAGGILADDLGIKPGEMPTEENLQVLYQRDNARPNAVIPAFIW